MTGSDFDLALPSSYRCIVKRPIHTVKVAISTVADGAWRSGNDAADIFRLAAAFLVEKRCKRSAEVAVFTVLLPLQHPNYNARSSLISHWHCRVHMEHGNTSTLFDETFSPVEKAKWFLHSYKEVLGQIFLVARKVENPKNTCLLGLMQHTLWCLVAL